MSDGLWMSALGLVAAALTSLSYIPQVRKALPRGSTSDLSRRMLIALTAGLVCWVVYGIFKSDWVIVIANIVGATLSGIVLACKMRDARNPDQQVSPSAQRHS
jgi:MtN3 and saliva related transmembrane protein